MPFPLFVQWALQIISSLLTEGKAGAWFYCPTTCSVPSFVTSDMTVVIKVMTTTLLSVTKDFNWNFNQSSVNFILWITEVTKSLRHVKKTPAILCDRNLACEVGFVTLVSFWERTLKTRITYDQLLEIITIFLRVQSPVLWYFCNVAQSSLGSF